MFKRIKNLLLMFALVPLFGCDPATTVESTAPNLPSAPALSNVDNPLVTNASDSQPNTLSGPNAGHVSIKGEAKNKISMVAWNVESGGNDPNVIAAQLSELPRYDIYCLSEVSPKSFALYRDAVGKGYQSIESRTGRADRLQILFDGEQFELLESKELDLLNNGTHRSPMFVRLRHKRLGRYLVVMTNHLARRDAELRRRQAAGIREWARDIAVTMPTVCIGDMNMDYTFATGKGNDSFAEMLRDGVWTWVKPVELIDTNWSDGDGDGKDNYPGSMLDLAFVAGAAKEWDPVCRVLKQDGDFPDDETTSDHRPIELVFNLKWRLTDPMRPGYPK